MERKKIEGEQLTDPKEALERMIEKRRLEEVETDAKKRPELTTRQSIRVRYYNFKQRMKRRIMSIMTRQTEKAIRKQVTDQTWYGKILFGILDVLPLPNIHEIWKSIQKELPDGTIKEKMQLFWIKIDGWRTVTAIAVSILFYYQLLG